MSNKFLPISMFAAALALTTSMLTSCNQSDPLTPEKRTAQVEVHLKDLNAAHQAIFATKASGAGHNNASQDKAKNTLQLYVFNENDQLESYRSLSGSEISDDTKLTFDVVAGKKKVWAVANSHAVSDFANVKSVAALGALYADLKKENVGDFTMAGVDSVQATTSATPASVTVDLKRMVARVHIGTVKVQMSGGFGEDSLTNAKVYLINAYNKALLSSMKGKSGSMMNSGHFVPGDTTGFAMKDIACHDIANITTTAQNVDQYFYAYGNDGSAGVTKLVVQGNLAGQTYYYPINVTDAANGTVLSANTALNITDITITRPGSTDPNVDVAYGSIKFNIQVVDWNSRDASDVIF